MPISRSAKKSLRKSVKNKKVNVSFKEKLKGLSKVEIPKLEIPEISKEELKKLEEQLKETEKQVPIEEP